MYGIMTWRWMKSLRSLIDPPRKIEKASKKWLKRHYYSTQEQTMEKLTEFVGGRRRIRNDPPFLVYLSETVPEGQEAWIAEQHVEKLFKEYLHTLPEEKHQLVSHFRISIGALRIGGIGSIGTRCLVLLLEGTTKDDALILQLKEAGPSVLEPYCPKERLCQPTLKAWWLDRS